MGSISVERTKGVGTKNTIQSRTHCILEGKLSSTQMSIDRFNFIKQFLHYIVQSYIHFVENEG